MESKFSIVSGTEAVGGNRKSTLSVKPRARRQRGAHWRSVATLRKMGELRTGLGSVGASKMAHGVKVLTSNPKT